MRCTHPHRWKCTQVVPDELKTIGDHLKKRRLALHLMQNDVARRLGVHKASVQNWERGVSMPGIRQMPRIIEFLGYDPEPEPAPDDIPRRIAYARRRLGFTQDDLARALQTGIVPIWRWETGQVSPPKAKLRRLQELLDGRFVMYPEEPNLPAIVSNAFPRK